jgi:Na+/proline symporter/signal transduction histidine kinase/ActR/RegA family two-component response regulator
VIESSQGNSDYGAVGMIPGWSVVLSALLYLCALFAVAYFADTSGRKLMRGRARATIYALALAVYCTSWTFYGSVGFATRSGLDFLAIYLGPILVIGFGHRLIERIVRITKAQNITSVADFVGARYGKSERVAALVCIVAVIGALPYIALQLKAVSISLQTILAASSAIPQPAKWPVFGDLAFIVALVLAGFAVAFGTRHADATEHQDGLVLAIALESVVKMVAFLAVGLFVTFWLYSGPSELLSRTGDSALTSETIWNRTSSIGTFLTLTVLSGFAAILLPRQFHIAIVENRDASDVRRAAWMFPLYLILINLFVIPITIAGEDLLRSTAIDRDMTVLLLPLEYGAKFLALLVFVGGLSAATAMVIVASIALAIMISNHLVMPLVLRLRNLFGPVQQVTPSANPQTGDLGTQVLLIRRLAIVSVMALGYWYFRAAGDAGLAAIGLLSFAAIAQVAPAFFGGLMWRRGTALGASGGLLAGIACWAYTLLIPGLARSDGLFSALVANGPWGISALRPEALFFSDMPSLTHGVVWSLSLNVLIYIAFSMLRPANAMERLQANVFVASSDIQMGQTLRLWRSSISVSELQGTIARYLGDQPTRRAFDGFAATRGTLVAPNDEADIHLMRFGENLLASAIGAASSRLVLSLLLKRRNLTSEAAFKLLDDASAALQYNRDILQNALDHAGQGITVLDQQLRLRAWNQAFVDLYGLPSSMVHSGVGIDEIVRFNAQRGSYGDGRPDDLVATRLESLVNDSEPVRLRLHPGGRVIEIRSNPLPGGGLVTTYTDISDTAAAEEALEQRVQVRTEELSVVNAELKRAKEAADEANISKTRFLAAASHDLLQPLNAARLYAASLVERDQRRGEPVLAENVDASLDAVEEILTALLDISRLDSGAMKPEWSTFRLDEIFRQLQREFEPIAQERGLRLRFVFTRGSIRSDRRLLRRLLQNLISNAIKYTPSGTVLVGCRWRGDKLSVKVLDTGMGIHLSKQKLVFREFQRLDEGMQVARGLGLGLSIVQRIARTLKHPLDLSSTPGRGTVFSLELPISIPAAQTTVQAQVASLSIAAQLGSMRVLVLDNEPAILDSMRVLLEGWGCKVVLAGNISDARSRARAHKPDVLFADYHLDHGEEGLSAIDSLRKMLGAELPAVLVTADRSIEVRDRALAAQVHILNKPLKPAALRALLAQWRVATATAAE